jgi:hypothetical protein
VTGTAGAPADVVTAVADRLVGYVTRYEAARDNRAVFAYLYLCLTRNLAEGLRTGDPDFDDPAWVAHLAHELAAEYFAAADALDAWLAVPKGTPDARVTVKNPSPTKVPEPWRDVYAAISDRRSYVLEDALFSMMAHISYDLPRALRKMASPDRVRPHIADFHRMNEVLGTSIDAVQEQLAHRYSLALSDLDRLFARDDELLSNYGIRLSRGMAWFNYERLVDASASTAAESSIRRATGEFIRHIRAPENRALRIALGVGRCLVPERRRWPPPGPAP